MLAVELDRACDHNIAELDVRADASAGGDEYLWLDGRCDLGHEAAHRILGAVIIKVQPGFEQKRPLAADCAWKVKAEAMVVSRHVGAAVVERRLCAGHQRDIACDV